MFKTEVGNWTKYRDLPGLVEVDFHFSEIGEREVSYDEAMSSAHDLALEALRKAHSDGKQYVLFTHGSSTSRSGKTTCRSVVRQLMRSSEATPYVSRRDSIIHANVFVAAIKHGGLPVR